MTSPFQRCSYRHLRSAHRPEAARLKPCGSRWPTSTDAILDKIRQQPGMIAAGALELVCRSKWGGAIRFMSRASRVPARRGLAASAVPERQRGLLRSDGRAVGERSRVHRVRQPRFDRRRDRQRVLRAALPGGWQPGRPGDSHVGHRHRSARHAPEIAAELPAATGGHAVRGDWRREGRAQRAARPGGGAGDLLHDAAVSVLGSVHRGEGRRCAALRRRQSAMRFARWRRTCR